MHRPSFRSVLAALSGKLFRPGLATAIFGARLLLGFATPSLLFAHESHPAEQPAVTADENAFLRENEAAMTKMMNGMDVKPTGDIDRDFVAMMNPHHQGAIDMAIVELRFGKDERLRRLAQGIIVEQGQEITLMRSILGDTPAPGPPADSITQAHPGR